MVEISTGSREARLKRRGHISRALALAFLVCLCIGAVAGPALAQSSDTELSTDDQVILNGRAVVPAGETVGSVTIFNGPAVIEGTVRDTVVVFNGDTEIVGHRGTRRGLVQRRRRDPIGRRGRRRPRDVDDPTIEQGATVRGSQQNVATRFDLEDFGLASRIAWWIGVTISTIILGMALLLFAPRAAESLEMVVRARLGSSIAWGVGLLFLLPIVAIIALVTIVALPLGLALLAGLGLLFMVGYVAATFVVGRLILKPPQSPYLAFLVGWVILRLLALIPVVGGIVWVLASAWGLGLLAVAARREGTLSRERVAETPPPTPSLP